MSTFEWPATPSPMDQGLTVHVERESDVVLACQKGRGLAARLGFSAGDQVAISIAISEVARNIIVHAGQGHISFYSAEGNGRGRLGIVVVARDQGPGIADLERAMQDGYSTSGGLGVGLSGAKRLTDEFHVVSRLGAGTTVTLVKWLP